MARSPDHTFRRRILTLTRLLAPIALAVVLAACGGLGEGKTPGGGDPGAAVRAVAVHPEAVSSPSRPGEPLSAWLIEGTMPAGPTSGTVQTDENCAPDEHGISRCVNRIRLGDGAVITVRHAHDMRVVPCLAPGEEVEVRPAA